MRQEILFYSTIAGGLGGIACVVQLFIGNIQVAPTRLSGPWPLGFVAAVLYVVNISGTLYFRKQQRKTQRKLDDIKNTVDPLQLQIQSAKWGIDTHNHPVRDAIDAKTRNALMFYVNQDAFPPPDPALGNDNKYVEITYSYSGSGPLTVRRKQGSWIVLPEDPWTRDEQQRLTQRVSELENECETLRRRIPPPEVNYLEGVDDNTFRLLRNEYPIVWKQRLALKWLWAQPSLELNQFRLTLENNGFANYETEIVQPILANKAFVESTETKLWIRSADARKVLAALFKEGPLC